MAANMFARSCPQRCPEGMGVDGGAAAAPELPGSRGGVSPRLPPPLQTGVGGRTLGMLNQKGEGAPQRYSVSSVSLGCIGARHGEPALASACAGASVQGRSALRPALILGL